jgi:hypothetical protein
MSSSRGAQTSLAAQTLRSAFNSPRDMPGLVSARSERTGTPVSVFLALIPFVLRSRRETDDG